MTVEAAITIPIFIAILLTALSYGMYAHDITAIQSIILDEAVSSTSISKAELGDRLEGKLLLMKLDKVSVDTIDENNISITVDTDICSREYFVTGRKDCSYIKRSKVIIDKAEKIVK